MSCEQKERPCCTKCPDDSSSVAGEGENLKGNMGSKVFELPYLPLAVCFSMDNGSSLLTQIWDDFAPFTFCVLAIDTYFPCAIEYVTSFPTFYITKDIRTGLASWEGE